MWVGGKRHARAALPLKRPCDHSVRGWMGEENLATEGIRSSNRPARS